MISIDWNPKEKTLRQFGWISLGGFGLLASLAWFKFCNHPAAITLGMLAILAPVLGVINPKLLKPLFIGLSIITFPIGIVVSNLVLLLIFLLVFTPLALIFKMIGRDVLRLRLDRSTPSYWRKYDQEKREPASYYRPF